MTWTLGLILFGCGLLVGVLLSGPLGQLAARVRKVFYKPLVLQPYVPGKAVSAPSPDEQEDREPQA